MNGPVDAVTGLLGGHPPADEGEQVGQPDVGDEAGDNQMCRCRLARAEGAGQQRVDRCGGRIKFRGGAGVGRGESPGHGVGQQRLALPPVVEVAGQSLQSLPAGVTSREIWP